MQKIIENVFQCGIRTKCHCPKSDWKPCVSKDAYGDFPNFCPLVTVPGTEESMPKINCKHHRERDNICRCMHIQPMECIGENCGHCIPKK
jgi:hypothetical protein